MYNNKKINTFFHFYLKKKFTHQFEILKIVRNI